MAYWLMKSEPDIFSITNLKEMNTAYWEGVRNYQARNFIRAMQPNDMAFFYHSSCATPGIVGIMIINSLANDDPSQFNPNNLYFDIKSTLEKPRWSGVFVKFSQQFIKPITLSELKNNIGLHDFILTKKGSRLSVMPVTSEQWHSILKMQKDEANILF